MCRIWTFSSRGSSKFSLIRGMRICSRPSTDAQSVKSSSLSTSGTWKVSSTSGPPDTDRCQEAFTSQKASTRSATWISAMVCSSVYTTLFIERLLLPIPRLPQPPTPIGSLVTTESPIGSTSTETCDHNSELIINTYLNIFSSNL